MLEDASKNYVARQTFDDEGLAITMVKYRAAGTTLDGTFKKYTDNPFEMAKEIHSRTSYTELPEVEGRKAFHVQMEMPMIISNRSIFTVLYRPDRGDGSVTLMSSSQGNDAIAESRATEAGSDVIAN